MRKNKNVELTEEDIPKSVLRMQNKGQKHEKYDDKTLKPKHKKSIFKKIIFILLIILILYLIIKIAISTYRWKKLAKEMLINQNSVVVDIDGNIIASLGEEKKKETISSEQIPSVLKNAYVSIEDERFYSHHGVDIKRTASAIANYIIHFGKSSFGGSTITQQLVKNLSGDSTDSIIRKIKEWWRAWQLETCTSKDEILTAYLNAIYVGPNVYGVEAGAKYYFNKSAEDLSLEECAFLAGINNSPNSYNPFTDEDNTEKIKKRTKTVLSKMKELGYISNDEYNGAIEKVDNGLNFKKGEIISGNRSLLISYRCTYQ